MLMPLDIRLSISRASPNAEIIQQRIDHHLAIMKADDLSIYHQYPSSLFEPRVAVLKTQSWIFQAALIGGLMIAALLIIAQLLRWKIAKKSRKLVSSEAQYYRFFNGVAIALCEGDSSRALIKLQ
ncbi:MAG: hypothetical protein KZQ66_12645 [Candidatus Thiodiazotropha sp. (ex Lucinoma aequizonata)]|nr:hypothetical protein [Candidatus Thiodiazotropha sp. (ex Lucinoma aequizonata)]MCU7896178.1 hypothetical protein [Candidatus Thiodiazotropha sp. (ex Lucinoma aequizonata)]MCU7898909.1 hypothetical protein [Candidatus Thiodiazotropha sp. (ex Lucinoma aequizonata)]MCU7902730.1 hypothetical protein [Candidatus Thiodiazotropha sp. (ex Lucinoma aequizonata)]MCU7909117.1 hypothetical protein [Candidatus Thiodiazotropha sp. (ex Lucinoma aequizonata)]